MKNNEIVMSEWNTYGTMKSKKDRIGDEKSAGGLLHWQVRLHGQHWEYRLWQTNGEFEGFGRVCRMGIDMDGNHAFAKAQKMVRDANKVKKLRKSTWTAYLHDDLMTKEVRLKNKVWQKRTFYSMEYAGDIEPPSFISKKEGIILFGLAEAFRDTLTNER